MLVLKILPFIRVARPGDMVTLFDALVLQKQIPCLSEFSSINKATPFMLMLGFSRLLSSSRWNCTLMGLCGCDVVGVCVVIFVVVAVAALDIRVL